VQITGSLVKVTTTVRASFMVTLQVVPLTESQPLKLVKVEQAPTAAVKDTVPFHATGAVQVVPQLMPPPVTVPAPVPVV